MPFTRAHPMFDEYRREAMTPVRTLAQTILARTGAARHGRLERELQEAIIASDRPMIERKLDELETLERQIAALPAMAREASVSCRSRSAPAEGTARSDGPDQGRASQPTERAAAGLHATASAQTTEATDII
jgi:hypothetical protein